MNKKERKLFLLCENSGYPLYEELSIEPANSVVKKIPCAGRLEKDKILDYLAEEYDKVIIVSCFEGSCHYVYGNARCSRKIQAIKQDLKELGLDSEMIEFYNISANMHDEFRAIIGN